MNRLLVALLIVLSVDFFAQCTFTASPNQIYYPNSVNTPTAFSFMSADYLCGPNTILNDTIGNGCYTMVNANCTLTIKPNCSYCPAYITVWAKNNSVINLLPGNCNLLYIYQEPLAVINNPFNVQYQLTPCSAINFANVNCTSTSLIENTGKSESFEVFPNPANDYLNIKFDKNLYSKIEIVNCLGQIVKEEILQDNISSVLQINDLKNGIYTINLINLNSNLRNCRRFVISR